MTNGVAMMMLAVIGAISMQVRMTAAKTMIVGGDIGWRIPPAATTYSDWASNHTFSVNDVLVFNFLTGGHNVAEAKKSAYEECDTSSVIKLHSVAPVNITLRNPGQVFFFCAIPGHCDDAGQKLAINVTEGRKSPTPAQAPTPLISAPAPAAAMFASSLSMLLPDPFVYLTISIMASKMLIFI